MTALGTMSCTVLLTMLMYESTRLRIVSTWRSSAGSSELSSSSLTTVSRSGKTPARRNEACQFSSSSAVVVYRSSDLLSLKMYLWSGLKSSKPNFLAPREKPPDLTSRIFRLSSLRTYFCSRSVSSLNQVRHSAVRVNQYSFEPMMLLGLVSQPLRMTWLPIAFCALDLPLAFSWAFANPMNSGWFVFMYASSRLISISTCLLVSMWQSLRQLRESDSTSSRRLGYSESLSEHWAMTLPSSVVQSSTHLREGSFIWVMRRLQIASKAMSGVKRPVRIPWMLRMAKEISFRSVRSSYSILTSSKGKRSWKILLMRAPPESSEREMSSPEPSILLKKSSANCWQSWSMTFVLRDGSSASMFFISDTSFSSVFIWCCSLPLSSGSVSRMWLVSCWLRTFWR
eukprot:Opistho-2@7609